MKRNILLILICLAFITLLGSIGFLIYVKRLHRSISRLQTAGRYVEEGRLDKAVNILKDILQKNPHDAGAHAALGMVYHKQHLYDEALSELKTALTINPDLINIYKEMYIIYKKKGMEEEARQAKDAYDRLKKE